MEIYHERPAEKRSETEEGVYDFLEAAGVPFRRMDHAPVLTMEDCLAIDDAAGFEICKNLFLCNRQGTEFYLLLLPGGKPFRTSEFSRAVGSSRLSFATAEQLMTYLSLRPGAVSVMGLLYDRERRVHLYIDEDLLSQKEFGCHPAVNTSTVLFSTEDLLGRVLPRLGRELKTVKL